MTAVTAAEMTKLAEAKKLEKASSVADELKRGATKVKTKTKHKRKRVVVTDNTLRRTAGVIQNNQLMLYQDRQHRKVQQTTTVERVLEGRHLEHALKRARRWMRKPRGRAPGHIAIFLAALHKVDPEGFKAMVRDPTI